jgi:hypothetical protein
MDVPKTCEATIALADPATGDTLIINLFRDEAALEAFQAYSKQKIAEAEGMGAKVAPGRIPFRRHRAAVTAPVRNAEPARTAARSVAR